MYTFEKKARITEEFDSTFICSVCKDDTSVEGTSSETQNNPVVGLINRGNNCWLNCLIQIILHTKEISSNSAVPIFVRGNRYSNILTLFLQNTSNSNTVQDVESTILDVTAKQAFAEITNYPDFNTSRQQDICDAFNKLLEHSLDFPHYEYSYRNIFSCTECKQEFEGQVMTEKKKFGCKYLKRREPLI